MFNKIYSKTKNFIKEYLLFIFFTIILLMVLNISVPYYIEAPGGIIDLNRKVNVYNGYDSLGTLNLTYVSSYNGNIATYLISKIYKHWDLVPEEEVKAENEDREDVKIRNRLMLENSLSNAYYVAYKNLNKNLEVVSSNVYVVYIDESANTDIEVGDKIVKIDNKDIKTIEDIRECIQSKNVGDYLSVIVNDGEKKSIIVRELDNKKSILISAICNYDYKSDIEFNFENGESGPSGGLMIALSIYDQSIKEDLTKGMKIAGTGTIDIEGNVGEISGIKYKIIGASRADVDVFFVPYENYEEAKQIIENNNYNINLVRVKTFSDALNYLIK